MSKNNKKNNKMIYYARILIAISIAILVYGLILDINNNVRLIDPEKSVKILNDDNGKYTSIDTANDEVTINSNENTVSNDETVIDNNESISQSHIVNYSDDNNSLRDKIEKKYNIEIKYGPETDGYIVGGLSTVPINDENTISSVLNNLENILSLYPYGLFDEIKKGGIPLTIYLINSYSDESVTGATDSNYSFANISIAVVYPLEESFYHESYHYIERYILKKGLTFNSELWNGFNPVDFQYGNINNSYSYKSTFSEDSYFVNGYAQVAPEEDRASTFEYMMAPTKASCLNNDKPVWKKARIMSNTIDAALNTVSPNNTEYWERFL